MLNETALMDELKPIFAQISKNQGSLVETMNTVNQSIRTQTEIIDTLIERIKVLERKANVTG